MLPDLGMFMTKIGRGRWVGTILGPLGYSPRRDLENMLPASSSSHVMDLDIFLSLLMIILLFLLSLSFVVAFIFVLVLTLLPSSLALASTFASDFVVWPPILMAPISSLLMVGKRFERKIFDTIMNNAHEIENK